MTKFFIFLFFIYSNFYYAQNSTIKNILWRKAPKENEISAIHWQNLTNKEGLGFQYAENLEMAYILNQDLITTSKYTGLVKSIDTDGYLKELAYCLMGRWVIRYSFNTDRSLERIEFVNLPVLHDLLESKNIVEYDQANSKLVTEITDNHFLSKSLIQNYYRPSKNSLQPDNTFLIGTDTWFQNEKISKEFNVFSQTNYNDIDSLIFLLQSNSFNSNQEKILGFKLEIPFKELGKRNQIVRYCEYERFTKIEMNCNLNNLVFANGDYKEFENGILKCRIDDIVNNKYTGTCPSNFKITIDLINNYSKNLYQQLNQNAYLGVLDNFSRPTIVNAPKSDDDEFVPPIIENPGEDLTFVEEEFVEEEAEYLGGYASMMKYIQDNMNYPESAIEKGIQGRVILRFIVEKDGQVSNVSVVKGLSPECDKAAVKVVSDMPKWKPGKIGGRPVRQWCTIPINFTLN